MEQEKSFNDRQYSRMLQVIEEYKGGSVSFGKLVNNLEGLIGALDNISVQQRNNFYAKWGELEELYAVKLDQESEMEQSDFDFIFTTLSDFVKIIAANQKSPSS